MQWTQIDNTVISIDDMTEKHIINAIAWLTRDKYWQYEFKDGYSSIFWVNKFTEILINKFQYRTESPTTLEEILTH